MPSSVPVSASSVEAEESDGAEESVPGSSAAGADGRGGGTLARVGRGDVLCLNGGLGCTAGGVLSAFSEDDAAAV